MDKIVTVIDGIQIGVKPGEKSKNDFIVRYKMPGKRERQPKHIHLVIDILLKQQGDPVLTKKLIIHLIDVLKRLKPITQYPPKLQVFRPNAIRRFNKLNRFGEYKVEFLLAIFELIMIQEATNYPEGTMSSRLFKTILDRKDIFSIVSAATFRGR